MTDKDVQAVVEFIKERAASAEYVDYCRDLLTEMIAIDTAIQSDIDRLRANEDKVFAIAEREVKAILGNKAKVLRLPIDCRIEEHPYYSGLYYTTNAQRKEPLTCEQTYKGRYNLVIEVEPDAGGADHAADAFYNAHIDTVGPFFGPRMEGPLLFGRGACDDKGEVVLLIAQMKLIAEAQAKFGLKLGGRRVYQFVIEEEMGGNGSLSLAVDGRYAGYEAIIHEITRNIPHPANRGCVWYQCTIGSAGQGGARTVEMWPFVIRALEDEGAKIKAEGAHPLFKPEHVQTNHGVLGPYGEHPSAVNDHVAVVMTVEGAGKPEQLRSRVEKVVDMAVQDYVARYGDKTKEADPETGKPKVARHYNLEQAQSAGATAFRLDIHGKAGHMGAVVRCDGAITKAAWVVRALLEDARTQPPIAVTMSFPDAAGPVDPLALEGGQGFVPTHEMDDVMKRLADAAALGAQEYCTFAGVEFRPGMVDMRYDKLHNNAFATDVESPGMKAFRWAFDALGREWPEPTGWQVSCDARIFAKHGHNVVTFGPGSLDEAHSDTEHLDLRQVPDGLAISTLQAIRLAGGL